MLKKVSAEVSEYLFLEIIDNRKILSSPNNLFMAGFAATSIWISKLLSFQFYVMQNIPV